MRRALGAGRECNSSPTQAAFAALDGIVLELIKGVDEQGVERAIRYLRAVLAGSAEVPSRPDLKA